MSILRSLRLAAMAAGVAAVFAGDVDAHQVCSEDRKEFESAITADEGCVPVPRLFLSACLLNLCA